MSSLQRMRPARRGNPAYSKNSPISSTEVANLEFNVSFDHKLPPNITLIIASSTRSVDSEHTVQQEMRLKDSNQYLG